MIWLHPNAFSRAQVLTSKCWIAIIHVSLIFIEPASNEHHYHAFWYTWSSKVLNHKATGVSREVQHVLSITKSAIRHICHSTSVRRLWVDSICINQQDVEERNDQVARISDIYTSAEGVIISLGPDENNSSLAIDVLRLLPSKIEIHWPYDFLCCQSSRR